MPFFVRNIFYGMPYFGMPYSGFSRILFCILADWVCTFIAKVEGYMLAAFFFLTACSKIFGTFFVFISFHFSTFSSLLQQL